MVILSWLAIAAIAYFTGEFKRWKWAILSCFSFFLLLALFLQDTTPDEEAVERGSAASESGAPLTAEEALEQGDRRIGRWLDYQGAIALYTQAIELNPNYAKAYHSRGLAYYKLEDYQNAIHDFFQAIYIDPNYASAYRYRGIAYHDLGDYQKAIADYDKAIKLEPKYLSAYLNLGSAYNKLRDYSNAVADYDQAIKLDPEYPFAYNNRAMIYVELKDYKRATVEARKACKMGVCGALNHMITNKLPLD
jgi:tetratricopeptide (TPR) repeat protein